MKNIIEIFLLIVFLVISTSCKSTPNKELNYDNFDLAILVEENGEYKIYSGIDWPSKEDYTFNISQSTCKNGSGLKWDEEKWAAYLTTDKWDKCTAKFDKIIKIEKIEDLVDLSLKVNKGDSLKGKTVKLMNDLDFKKADDYKNSTNKSYGDFNKDDKVDTTIFDELTNTEGAGFVPIGTAAKPFEGNFDGNGYTINNIYIFNQTTNSTEIGFFGDVKNGKISNLTITGEYHSTVTSNIGGIVSQGNGIIIENCHNLVKITNDAANGYIGGILGNDLGGDLLVKKCSNEGEINGGYNVGGLIGNIASGATLKILNSYNKGIIINSIDNRSTSMGGIVGRGNPNSNLIMEDCFNEGTLTSTSSISGGLLGGTYNTTILINKSFNNGKIYSDKGYASGLIGFAYSNSQDIRNAYILNSYNTGNIESNLGAQGLLLIQYGKIYILNSYNKGKSTISSTQSKGLIWSFTNEMVKMYNVYNSSDEQYSLGYFNNRQNNTIEEVYYIKRDGVQGSNANAYGIGISENQMKGTELLNGKNFVTTLNNNICNINLKELKLELINDELIDDNSNLTILNWVSGSDGYPVLEGLPN